MAELASASSTRYSVAVQVNAGYEDLFCNWLHHFRALRSSGELWALAYGDHTFNAVRRQLEPGHVLRATATDDGSQHTFNTPSFNTLALDKIQLIKDVLDRAPQQPVVFTDVDTVWLRNPLDLLPLPPFGIAALPEGYADEKRNATVLYHFCTCFVVARNDQRSRAFLERWQRFVAAASKAQLMNEQEAFNRVLLGDQYRRRKLPLNATALEASGVFALPHSSLPSGDTKAGVARRDQINAQHAWVHANWLSGHAAKVARLSALGVWKPECSQTSKLPTATS